MTWWVTVIMVIIVLLLSYILIRASYAIPLFVSPSVANHRTPLNTAHLDNHGVGIGIDDETLNSFPKMSYSVKDSRSFNSGGGNELEEAEDKKCCSICLNDYQESDVVRVIPDCGHMFHKDCVDEWLRLHPTCPVCRTSPLPSQRSSISLAPEAAAATILTVLDHDSNIRPSPGLEYLYELEGRPCEAKAEKEKEKYVDLLGIAPCITCRKSKVTSLNPCLGYRTNFVEPELRVNRYVDPSI